MRRYIVILPLLLGCGTAEARDGFEAVRCGGDVRAALMGKRTSDEPVVRIEARRKDIGLKDLGGDEISDNLNSTAWLICGKEYVVLTDTHEIVRDVLAFPPHSKTSPEFAAGTCRANGRKVPGTIIAVLDNRGEKSASPRYSAQDETLLPATSAWKLEEKSARFVPISTSGLSCPRSGIITQDGGP